MSKVGKVMVIGLGEIGRPLLEVLSRSYKTIGVDIVPPAESPGDIDVMHVCYPFRIHDFVGETVRYIQRFTPGLTVIHSTVAVGTTRTVEHELVRPWSIVPFAENTLVWPQIFFTMTSLSVQSILQQLKAQLNTSNKLA